MTKSLSILGSTGSIGRNALRVVENLGEQFEVTYLTAARDSKRMMEQIRRFRPRGVALLDDKAAREVRDSISGEKLEILSGREGILEIAGRDDVDIMLNALVGGAGMEPTISAIMAGVNVALSNKESLVMAGHLINQIKNETGVEIFPVDSEHSAIWQCLAGEDLKSVKRLILTGSGGPFRTRSRETFSEITVEEALKHPNWKMGSKITVDSASMMNKGLEVIEAHWLFGFEQEMIQIVVHPQSVIHSMVEFTDGSIKAQMGLPDMKIPIQYALTYPDRYRSAWEDIDFSAISPLTFEEPDLDRFPCIHFAYEALTKGGSAPAALNVANDNTVRCFLNRQISFSQISEINGMALREHDWVENPDLNDLKELEEWGADFVKTHIAERILL
ncbi:MAG: 1-deoxy-D-xylulose-5-phosphate reductoisomerase [Candidatus Neomarinimicrobiota bacterium]